MIGLVEVIHPAKAGCKIEEKVLCVFFCTVALAR
jgi:hypothetical protein